MDENKLWQKLAAEILGTAFLVFVGVGSVVAIITAGGPDHKFDGSDLGWIDFSFAAIVVVTVYVFGYISGNHINPAVTIALAVTGKHPWSLVVPYLLAQVVGAILGSLGIAAVHGDTAIKMGIGAASYGPSTSIPQALFAEFIGTFILVFGVFGVIYRKATPGWAGLAIGLTVFAAIITVAPATSASINPARTVGPMIVATLLGGGDAIHWDQLWVYLVAEFLGGIAAAVTFGIVAHTIVDKKAAVEASK